MATSPHETKAALLEAVAARARDTAEDAEAADVERFVRSYYANVAPEDLIDRSELDLAGAALAHWGLARVRRPGELKAHVYTPSLEEHGWESPHTVVETIVEDMPFLVDSVSMEVSRHGRAIHLVVRPIMRMRRDDGGRLLEVGGDDGQNESLIHVELDRLPDAAAIEELRADLQRVLGDVRAAVEDWRPTRQRTQDILAELAADPPPVDPEELAEARAFLEWLEDDHFTFLGYREYDMLSEEGEDVLRAVSGSGLGILREKGAEPVSASFAVLPPEVRRRAREKHLLNLTKANSRATVHRPVYLDYVGVKRFDDVGEVAGERRFLGLYTHTAYRVTPWEIPVLRQKADRVLERSGLLPGSHDHKALVEILETYPRDALFQISEDELLEIAMGILHLGERRRVRLFVRRDVFGRFFSCLVFLPRDRFNTENRRRSRRYSGGVRRGQRRLRDARLGVGPHAAALRHLHRAGARPEYDAAEIEARLAAATREWTDDFRDALVHQLGEERGGAAVRAVRRGLPRRVPRRLPRAPGRARRDRMEQLEPGGDLAMSLYLPHASAHDHLAFKLLRAGQPIVLSDVMPLLEKMGVKVTDERPYEVRPREGPPVWIYDFGLQHEEGAEFQADDVRETFQDAFARVWRGDAESDGFNRLVLGAAADRA